MESRSNLYKLALKVHEDCANLLMTDSLLNENPEIQRNFKDMLQTSIRDFAKIDSEYKLTEQALEAAKDECDGENSTNVRAIYQSKLSTIEPETGEHPFVTKINKILKPTSNESVCEVSFNKSDGPGLLDPITKKKIVNPVKNKFCGHIYEKESILELIRIKTKMICPYVGCKKKKVKFSANHLTDNVDEDLLTQCTELFNLDDTQ